MTTVVGYIRVSTREQKLSGAGASAQKTAIRNEAKRRAWKVVWVEDLGVSGKSLRRPGLTAALHALEQQEAAAIVVAKLDRLSRSVQDFAAVLDVARKQGWSVIALDLGVDTTTPAGELVANVMASVAQWERRIIADRTKDALTERRAAGVRLGRPPMTPRDVVARIVALDEAGARHAHIARLLTTEQVSPPRGGLTWYRSTVTRIVEAEARRPS